MPVAVRRLNSAGFLLAAVAALAAGAATPAAMQRSLDTRALEQAISIGQSSGDADRRQFHQAYSVVATASLVDTVQIVTPFRRVELAAEERGRQGGNRMSQRDAIRLLDAEPDQLDVYVELSFHPLNTYVGVPPFDVALVAAGSTLAIEPRSSDRVPRYGTRVDSGPLPAMGSPVPRSPRGSQPLLGGVLIAKFDAQALDERGVYDVVVSESGKIVGKARVDLSRVR